MTVIYVAEPARPQLREVKPFTVPPRIPQPKAAAHAARVAELTRAWALAYPRFHGRDQQAFAELLPFGIGLSWWLDAGLIPTGNTRAICEAVWPAGWGHRPKEAMSADAPRYEAPIAWDRCPVPGPRGGECRESYPNWTRWITDAETGEWEQRQVCRRHLDVARGRANRAPDPAPNRGGVLAAVFPEIDTDALYRWAQPHWTPPGQPVPPDPVLSKPLLRLVIGEDR